MEEGIMFTRRASGLVRELTWLDIFIFCIAGPAASGINFYSVSTASENPGGSIGLAFAIGVLLFLPIMICIAITSSAMPRSGSLYITVSRVLDPSLGFFGGWMVLFGYGIAIGVLGFIVTGIIGGGFVLAGTAGGIPALVNIGNALGTATGSTIGGIVWTLIFWALTLVGIRSVKWTMRVLFLIPFVATAVAVLYFVLTSPASAEAAFNAKWGAGAFQAIIDAAKEQGWSPAGFSWPSTFNLLLVVIWAYTAIETMNYVGGEIKSPKTSMLKGFGWGGLAVGLMYFIVALTVVLPYGQFIPAYDYLYDNAQDVLEGIMPAISPSIPFYAASIIGPTWLGLLVVISIALWFANSILPIFLANSRLVFAMAMDRALPEFLATVNERRGTPTWAAHLTCLFGLFGVAIMRFAWGPLLGILNIGILFIMWGYGLAAMLLPYRKPELYELSATKIDVAGIPLVTILGFITFVLGMFFLMMSIMPFDNPSMLTVLVIIAIGFLVYLYQVHKTKKAGIDMAQIYSVVPPE